MKHDSSMSTQAFVWVTMTVIVLSVSSTDLGAVNKLRGRDKCDPAYNGVEDGPDAFHCDSEGGKIKWCQWDYRPSKYLWYNTEEVEKYVECEQEIECKALHTVSHRKTWTLTTDISVNASQLWTQVWDLLKSSEITTKYGNSWGQSWTTTGTVICNTHPGYKSSVSLRTEWMRLSGHVRYRWFTGAVPNPGECGEGSMTIDVPSKRAVGSLALVFSCIQKPIANMDHVEDKNDMAKMTHAEKTAVIAVLENMVQRNNVPTMGGTKYLSKTTNGIKVWGESACYNDLNNTKTYAINCRACIKELTTKIVYEFREARGAQWKVKDCFVKYEFYERS